jgi:hypothetical protein
VTPTVIAWQGNEYTLDAQDLTMGEYEHIARVTEPPIDGYSALHNGLKTMDFRAWKALFFVQDLRRDPNIRWSSYDGPTFRVIYDHFASIDDDEPAEDEPAADEQAAVGAAATDAEGKG